MKKRIILAIAVVLVLAAAVTFVVRSREQKVLPENVPVSVENAENTDNANDEELAKVPHDIKLNSLKPAPTPKPIPEPTPEPIEWFEEVREEVYTLNKTIPYTTFDEEAISIVDPTNAISKGIQLIRTGIGTKEVATWSKCLLPNGDTVYIATADLTTENPVVAGSNPVENTDNKAQELVETGNEVIPETAYTAPTNPNVFENTDPIPSSDWASKVTGGVRQGEGTGSGNFDYSDIIIG